MAVPVNESTASDFSSAKLHVGMAPIKVLSINPSAEKLKEYGFKGDKEQVYFKQSSDGANQLRLVFIVEAKGIDGEALVFPFPAIFLKDKKMDSVFVNEFLNISKDRSTLMGNIRNPYDGEIDILMFLKMLCGVKKDQAITLDTIALMVATGDVSELRDIIKSAVSKNNMVKAYLTVRDGKYQSAYSRKVEYPGNTNYQWMHKDFVKQKSHIKEDLGGIDFDLYNPKQFDLRLWSASDQAPVTTTRTLATAAVSSGNVNASAKVSDDDADDSPF